MTRRRITMRQRARYAFDNTMSKGTKALIVWLAIATAFLIAVFTIVVLVGGAAPENDAGHRPSWIRQVFNSLLHALDPGTIGGDTGRWPFLVLMLLLTLGGLLIVSALIGVISTGIDAKLQELRKGRSHVLERGHTLILGWADTVFTILQELAIANENEKNPSVVILAEHDKVEMEDAIRAKVPDLRGTRIVIRTGTAIDLDDLAIVNPDEARSIIVLAAEGEEPDAQVIKTVLALTQGPQRRPEPYHIVAVIHDPANLEAARLVGGTETILIDKRETIARLIVQASRQSGASVVYTELLDFEGDEVYFRQDPALVGKTFGAALLAYEECTVIGLAQNGSVTLNPRSDTPIGPDDRVIAVAEDDARLLAATPFADTIDEAAIASAPNREAAPQRVLLLGWNSRSPAVINELDNYLQPGSEVTVVADWEGARDAIAAECAELAHVRVEFRYGSTTDRRTLDGLGIAAFDQIVVMCYSELLDAQRADARTLVTLLHLRDIAGKTGARFSIVSEMLDDRNRELAQVTKVDDVIVSDRVVSLMITQISENPQLSEVFQDLFAAEGSEIYLRPATDYVQAGSATTFATVVEAARRRGEVAIGYRIQADAGDPAKSYGVRINLPKSAPIAPAPDDRVVVLAEQ